MRILFGVASLLVVLAVVGFAASRQLKTLSAPASPQAASGSTVVSQREQARQLQEQVQRDLNKALEQGARKIDPEQ
ncbi:MAG TPA: hypothetical protein VFL64_12360 [Rhizobacter sp.]|nr:hypothetical protein [Rhizobacter sp.]